MSDLTPERLPLNEADRQNMFASLDNTARTIRDDLLVVGTQTFYDDNIDTISDSYRKASLKLATRAFPKGDQEDHEQAHDAIKHGLATGYIFGKRLTNSSNAHLMYQNAVIEAQLELLALEGADDARTLEHLHRFSPFRPILAAALEIDDIDPYPGSSLLEKEVFRSAVLYAGSSAIAFLTADMTKNLSHLTRQRMYAEWVAFRLKAAGDMFVPRGWERYLPDDLSE